MATLVYAVSTRRRGTLRYASAGHPPPVVVRRPTATSTLLEEGARAAARRGARTRASRRRRAELPPGATLMLYTDGIVERRDMWIDEGIGRLTRGARPARPGADPRRCWTGSLESLLGAEGRGRRRRAAGAAARARRRRAAQPRRFPPTRPCSAAMRQTLRRWLADAGAERRRRATTCSSPPPRRRRTRSSTRTGPADATLRGRAAEAGDGEVLVVVRDHGSWRPPRGHNRGRGTMLMQELMDHFEVATGETRHRGADAQAAGRGGGGVRTCPRCRWSPAAMWWSRTLVGEIDLASARDVRRRARLRGPEPRRSGWCIDLDGHDVSRQLRRQPRVRARRAARRVSSSCASWCPRGRRSGGCCGSWTPAAPCRSLRRSARPRARSARRPSRCRRARRAPPRARRRS